MKKLGLHIFTEKNELTKKLIKIFNSIDRDTFSVLNFYLKLKIFENYKQGGKKND